MKVLIYKWKVYNYPAITAAFENMGHRTKTIEYDTDSGESRQAVVDGFADEINDFAPDVVFTVNYFGELSDACQACGIPYISWTCDSPLIAMYHESVFNDVNFIFIFDKVQYYYFKNAGVRHVYYLPLAADELMAARAEDIDTTGFESEISFVGSLYEKNSYDRIEDRLTPYLKGYFDAAMNAQADIFGDNIFDRLLTPDILAQLSQLIDFKNSERSLSDMGLVFNTTFLGFKMAQRERIGCLSLLGMNHEVKLYTDSHLPIEGVHNMGSVEYHNDMPRVFCGSDINMNFTIRNIRSGIPLRVWDIMACGGFVLTNFQAELPAYFEDGVHMAWFGSIDDMRRKADYYLEHDDERRQIAEQGRRFVMQNHTYRNRIEAIFNILEKEGAIYEQ